jgi:3-dehydroquinate synthase
LSISKCLIIVDHNVEKYYSILVRKLAASINCQTRRYIFRSNEFNKSLTQVKNIYNFLSLNSFGRDSAVIAIGGGIVGDISGYISSTYMRGIKYYQVPTTLLSMVDSSVGGKTGVNFYSIKNLIGTFYQPSDVFINKSFLNTLPKREMISGCGEIFKYAFLSDQKNYSFVKNNLERYFNGKDFNIEKLIESCLKIKSVIVLQDEREESGLRKILNLGHTFAHAFESESHHKLKHGEAVIGGIFASLFLSHKLTLLTSEQLNNFILEFKFLKPGKQLKKINVKDVYEIMKKDKKSLGSKIKLVLIKDIGNVVVDIFVDKDSIISSIKLMQNLI